MGGFLFNGCGAADTFSKLRLLKTDMCPNCRKEREFYLVKVRMKIHVVFIPTVPLSTKYGIVCSKCKTGVYISEEQMRQIMSADDETKVLLYEAIMHSGSAEGEGPADEGTKGLSGSGKPLTCPNCGQALSEGDAFCGMCGQAVTQMSDTMKPLQMAETDAQRTEQEPAARCPQCGNAVEKGAAFCGFCGAALKKPAGQEEPAARCPQCGNTVEKGAAFCGFCGAALKKPAAAKAKPADEAGATDRPGEIPRKEIPCKESSFQENSFQENSFQESSFQESSFQESFSQGSFSQGSLFQEGFSGSTRLREETPVHAHEEPKTWTCPLCDTRNPADADRCQLCGLKRA